MPDFTSQQREFLRALNEIVVLTNLAKAEGSAPPPPFCHHHRLCFKHARLCHSHGQH